jgi:hypothetical protein
MLRTKKFVWYIRIKDFRIEFGFASAQAQPSSWGGTGARALPWLRQWWFWSSVLILVDEAGEGRTRSLGSHFSYINRIWPPLDCRASVLATLFGRLVRPIVFRFFSPLAFSWMVTIAVIRLPMRLRFDQLNFGCCLGRPDRLPPGLTHWRRWPGWQLIYSFNAQTFSLFWIPIPKEGDERLRKQPVLIHPSGLVAWCIDSRFEF